MSHDPKDPKYTDVRDLVRAATEQVLDATNMLLADSVPLEADSVPLENVPGSYEWAKKQDLPTGRFEKRSGTLICYLSPTDEDYPERAEDEAAMDWQVDPDLSKQPLSRDNRPGIHKVHVAWALLAMCPQVRFGVDGTHPQLKIPSHLIGTDTVLEFGLKNTIPIPDLRVTQLGIKATLSFNGAPFECWIPWEAVYGIACKSKDIGLSWPKWSEKQA